ncbi:hypothetical protein AB0L41_46875 [Amycolatopsis mediterranei]|uniref:hypothetical protein n=1 Tax=Amycolatopsis mediterranei TaxID=33910 RepID=UPI003431B686
MSFSTPATESAGQDASLGSGRTLAYRLSKIITEALAPWVVIVILALAMAWKATSYRVGPTLLWAAVVTLFSAAIPMWVITYGSRAGRWDGHHVRNREGRKIPFLVCIGSTVFSVLATSVGHAPRPMVAMAWVMLAVLLVTAAITVKWKVSMHTAVSGGGVAMLWLLYSPLALLLLVVVGLIGWSRVVVRDHTAAQVAVGAIVGFVVSGVLYAVVTA